MTINLQVKLIGGPYAGKAMKVATLLARGAKIKITDDNSGHVHEYKVGFNGKSARYVGLAPAEGEPA